MWDASEGNATAGCEAAPNQPASGDVTMTTIKYQAAYEAYQMLDVAAPQGEVTRVWCELGHATRQLVAAALQGGDMSMLKGVDLDPVVYGGRRTNLNNSAYRFKADTNGCSQVVHVYRYGSLVARIVVRLGYWTSSPHQLVCVDKMV
jgi:hypothetical protein